MEGHCSCSFERDFYLNDRLHQWISDGEFEVLSSIRRWMVYFLYCEAMSSLGSGTYNGSTIELFSCY